MRYALSIISTHIQKSYLSALLQSKVFSYIHVYFATFFLLFNLVISPIKLNSQSLSNTQITNLFPFIHTDLNSIEHFGDNNNYSKFLQKFEELNARGKGEINIVHIGGSHVQADWFTNAYRQYFYQFERGLTGSRGFVFPYKMAHTNSGSTYKFESSSNWTTCRNVRNVNNCKLGLGGISITTTDTLANLKFSFKNNEIIKYDFKSLKLLHPFDSGEFSFRFDTTLVLGLKHYPDSGYSLVVFKHAIDSFNLEFFKSDSLQTHFTVWGFILETDEPGINIHNIGINGASIPSFLNTSEFFVQLPMIHPDLVVIGLGINDAHSTDFSDSVYIHNYNVLVTKIKESCPNAAIILLTNNDSYLSRKKVNKNGILVEKAIYKIAQENHLAVWNQFQIMGGIKSMLIWQKHKLAQKDKVHFTKQGYEIIGNLLFNAIINDYYQFLKSNN